MKSSTARPPSAAPAPATVWHHLKAAADLSATTPADSLERLQQMSKLEAMLLEAQHTLRRQRRALIRTLNPQQLQQLLNRARREQLNQLLLRLPPSSPAHSPTPR